MQKFNLFFKVAIAAAVLMVSCEKPDDTKAIIVADTTSLT